MATEHNLVCVLLKVWNWSRKVKENTYWKLQNLCQKPILNISYYYNSSHMEARQIQLEHCQISTNKVQSSKVYNSLTAVETWDLSPVGPSLASPKSESFGLKSSSNSTFEVLKSRYITWPFMNVNKNLISLHNEKIEKFRVKQLSYSFQHCSLICSTDQSYEIVP